MGVYTEWSRITLTNGSKPCRHLQERLSRQKEIFNQMQRPVELKCHNWRRRSVMRNEVTETKENEALHGRQEDFGSYSE